MKAPQMRTAPLAILALTLALAGCGGGGGVAPVEVSAIIERIYSVLSNGAMTAASQSSIGEPKHPTPALLVEALAASLRGLANYPTTIGATALREVIAAWLVRRHGLARRAHLESRPVALKGP